MSIHRLTERLLPGEANNELVVDLESLLNRAKKGEITALAWAGVTGNEHLITGWNGAVGTTFTLSASIMALNSRYATYMMEDD